MARWARLARALGVACAVSAATLSVSCQAIFGDFHVDDNAFLNGAAGAAGGGAVGNAGASGGGAVVEQGLIKLMPTSGLYTTEWGGQTTLSIVLVKQPSSTVTVGLSSSDTNEGNVSPQKVEFTKDNWNAPQIITVTGVDDTLPDGNKDYFVKTDPAVSDDPSYAGLDAIDVRVTNIDNETSGVTVTPTSGLVTSELGMQDTFTVVLNAKPTQDVTVTMTSSRPDEGTVDPPSLVFTAVNWMAPQLVTVTGVDDTKKDGPQSYSIGFSTASMDTTYQGRDVTPVQVTNQDNESAGLTVVLVNGVDPNDKTKLRTSENGDTATFTVQLISPPSGDVTIPVSSDSPKEGTVSPASLLFTTLNWMAPQTVTVTGQDDGKVADGDQPYHVLLGTPTGADADYAKLDPTQIGATNIDNDHPGFTVMLTSGVDKDHSTQLLTDESGATATFTIALNTQPSDKVTINLSSSLPTEGSVSPLSLVFTKDNWNGPQTVTVKGVDDKVQDGSPMFYVRTSAALSDDKGYAGLDPQDVAVTNRDNDSAGVVITLAGGIDPQNTKQLLTSESGDTATFTIALTSQPTEDVTIALVSNNKKEGTLAPSSVKFTAANYAAPQTITVTGVDDPVPTADGNQSFVIAVGAPASKDPNYGPPGGPLGQQVKVTNRDNDSAGIVVTPISGLVTSESGTPVATFTVKLTTSPLADVSIGVSSSNPAEGTVNIPSLKFTSANFGSPQTVTVTGVQDDGTADGPQAFKVLLAQATGADAKYSAIKPPDVSVTNLDDDTPGILVAPLSGLVTSESGGTATFTVALQSRPSAPVKITLMSSAPGEGSINPSVLNFTSANYKALQTVTVTGVNDPLPVQDGPQPYKIIPVGVASSQDGNYNKLLAPEVNVTNLDNDSAGIQILPSSLLSDANPGVTTESGGSTTFSVQLNSVPAGNVSFAVASQNEGEGIAAPALLTFTPANWNAAQTVTVTGVDDKVADNNVLYKVRLSAMASSDVNYSGKFGLDLPFSNVDNDHAQYVINAASNLQTSESGTPTATFTIALQSQPKSGVTVGLSSSNTAEGTVSPASLSFLPGTWNIPQTVTITGVDDPIKIADGPQGYSVLIANAVSGDSSYSGNFGTTVPVTNLDNDTPGFVFAGTTGLQTSETPPGIATFTIALATQPTSPNTVTIPLSSSNTKEGVVSPASLLFDVNTWSVPQTVTITGVNDNKADGLQSYAILLGPTTSGDANYANKSPTPVPVKNADNDMEGVSVTPTTCATTPGGTSTFSIRLNSQPEDSVSIDLVSDTPSQGIVAASNAVLTVVFTPDNWNVAQVITVTGVDDGTMMSEMTQYKIVTSNASSPGDTTGYNGADVADVVCTNTSTAPPAP